MPGLDNRQQPDHAQAESLVVDDCAGGGHCWVGVGALRERRRGGRERLGGGGRSGSGWGF